MAVPLLWGVLALLAALTAGMDNGGPPRPPFPPTSVPTGHFPAPVPNTAVTMPMPALGAPPPAPMPNPWANPAHGFVPPQAPQALIQSMPPTALSAGPPLPGAGLGGTTSLGGGLAGIAPSSGGVFGDLAGTGTAPPAERRTSNARATGSPGGTGGRRGSSRGSRRHAVERYSTRIRTIADCSAPLLLIQIKHIEISINF